MENTGEQQETTEQEKSRRRRTRESVRSDESLEEDAEFSRAWQEGTFFEELGEKVALDHSMKFSERDRAAARDRFELIAKSLAEVRPCFPQEWKYRENEDGLGPVEVSLCFPRRWKRDQLKISQEEELSFDGDGGVIPEEKRPQVKARYFKKSAIEGGSLRGRRWGAWRRLFHPNVGVFKRNEKTLKMEMTPRGKMWLEKIARAEAMRWASGNERIAKTAGEHMAPVEDGEPHRLKPKILTEELVHNLAFEWLRDDRALVLSLQSLIACYDNLSKPESFYPHKVTTAQAMSTGSLKTEDDDARLRNRLDALCGKGGGRTGRPLNKFKEEIREKGRKAVKMRTSPSG